MKGEAGEDLSQIKMNDRHVDLSLSKWEGHDDDFRSTVMKMRIAVRYCSNE